LRGAEIVSPLEGSDDQIDEQWISLNGSKIEFQLNATANPNNMTPATQAIAARVRVTPRSHIRAQLNGQTVEVTARRLLEGAKSGNLGPIDSPAYRLHPLPWERQWQWHGSVELPPFGPGDHVYVRMRQTNGQWAWTSPIFCRDSKP
jgi:hypothetical protein